MAAARNQKPPAPANAPKPPEPLRLRALAYAFPFAVFALVFAAYALLGSFEIGRWVNKATATTAVLVMAFTYLLGGIYRLVPAVEPLLGHRKYLGLAGFGFAVAHVLISLNAFEWNVLYVFSDAFPGHVAARYGLVAFLVFLVVALTSNKTAIEKLGYGTWKNVQRLGYVALLFTILHFAYVGRGQFLTHALGWFVLGVAVVAILARLWTLFAGPERPRPHPKVEFAKAREPERRG